MSAEAKVDYPVVESGSVEYDKEVPAVVKVVESSAHEVINSDVAEGTRTVRGLQAHHIQLIGQTIWAHVKDFADAVGIGSTIGTGLFLACGRSLIQAGPLGSLIAYILFCAICWGKCFAIRPILH